VARPRSDDKRSAILAAAVRVIVAHGLSAPTAQIAREAGVANGSLFTYFETKAALFNQLYLELKAEMASAALEGLPTGADVREQFAHAWTQWMRWAVRHPAQRRALALLGVADEITPASHAIGRQTMADLATLMERARTNGAMRDAPFALVAALMNAVAEATMDVMLQDSANADAHCRVGFDALWHMLS
jgi:AcrR family transcriptional regulator